MVDKLEESYDSKDYEIELSDRNLSTAKSLFLNNGFIVLRNSIPVPLINDLHKDVLDAIHNNKISNNMRDIHLFATGEVSSAHNLVEYIPSYEKLQNLENIQKFIKHIYGEISSEKFNSSYFAKPKEMGLETKPHQDNAFFCMDPAEVVTCWTPVTFANKENGCLYYLPGSHKLGNLSHLPEGNLGASMCIEESLFKDIEARIPKQYIELKCGDCVLHNALVVHGSEANYSNYDRNAFNFSIASKKATRDLDLYQQYKNKLEKFLANKKT